MIRTFEKFTDEEIQDARKRMLDSIEANKGKPQLKVGDIVDLDWGHVAKGARVFAKVINTFEPANVAEVETIMCNKRPYLCDYVFETLVKLYDTSILADMEVYKNKMSQS